MSIHVLTSLQNATARRWRIVAYVVGSPAPEPEELIEFVAQQLSVHKRPREVRIVDTLPRNAMGKVMKKALM